MSKEKLKVGVDLIKQLSTAFYPNITSVFSELVSNSSDAFSTEVRIEIVQEEDPRIIIEDNGLGMTHEELVKFFYISSTKKKNDDRIKKIGKIKREIIGKFGIGKLSMYRLCKKFEITTWKNGAESTATMDFDKFEENNFIDDFSLNVNSEKTGTKKTGTLIRMLDLKQEAEVRNIKRSLTKFMPLKPDFSVYINGIKLEPAKRNGSVLDLNEDIEGLGKVTGQIIITDQSIGEESKIYIRVFGRVVNESGEVPIKKINLTHGLTYHNRIYVDLNVNALDEAVLTNRSGFIEDNLKFGIFIGWLKKQINDFIRDVYDAQKQDEENTAEMIPESLSSETASIMEKPEFKDKWAEIEKDTGDFDNKIEKRIQNKSYVLDNVPKEYFSKIKLNKETQISPRLDELEASLSELKIGKRKIIIKVESLGKTAPESSLSQDGKSIIINKDNPLYRKSEIISFDALKLHCLKAIIVDLAITMSDGKLDVFKETYDLFTRQDFEIK
ncbi:MAG: ATP-binding protein [Candidatus Nanoarchaeia archaeon]|nr:ATP-binding protein [Candidatus Nanoarchaeia archaeon]MDD5740895.1 ATP-binding protein [Candidatus Nanoarchaeia archaeon]